MSEESKKGLNGKVTAIAGLIALAVMLIFGYYTGNWISGFGLFLLIFGVYEVASTFRRSDRVDQWGTSESGAAALWGFLFIAVGGALVLFQYSDNMLYAVLFCIGMIVLYLVYSIFSKKKD